MIPSVKELAEIGHNEANKFSYEGEWGVRKKSRSDKAAMDNFIAEAAETRSICFARAVRDAVLEGVQQEARQSGAGNDGLILANWGGSVDEWIETLKGSPE